MGKTFKDNRYVPKDQIKQKKKALTKAEKYKKQKEEFDRYTEAISNGKHIFA